MIRLALIPPLSLLDHTLRTDYQLVLPHLLHGSEAYRNHYKGLGKIAYQYLMLDNGANEDKQVPTQDLLKWAGRIEANEIIAPDVLMEPSETVKTTTGFLSKYKEAVEKEQSREFDIGIVAQGNSAVEARETVRRILEASVDLDVPVRTIHIPRSLISRRRDRYIRLDVVSDLRTEYGKDRFQYHLLGGSPLWPAELKVAAGIPGVRGMDTSMPYNYTLAHQYVEFSAGPVYRPDNYFATKVNELVSSQTYKRTGINRKELLAINVDTMLRWTKKL